MSAVTNNGAERPASGESLSAGERTDGSPSRAVFDPLAEDQPSAASKFCSTSDVRSTAVEDFDWDEYDNGGWKPREAKVQPEHLRTLFENGELWLDKAAAAKRLQSVAKVGRTAAYDALRLVGGRYSEMLCQRDDGKIGLICPGDVSECC